MATFRPSKPGFIMRQFYNFQIFLVSIFFLSSCHTTYQTQSVKYQDYRITTRQAANADINTLLKPYSDSVNKSMSAVIAVAGMQLEKKQPEGTLNNILADAMFAMAKEKYQTSVDAAFLNYGGIRLPALSAGNITLGKVYELSPFDNILILLKLDGKTLRTFMDHIASDFGGWPCAGVTWQIKDKKAVNISIAGSPLDDNKTYTIATIDYLANGGDNCDMLKPIPQINNGYLFRDAVIDYFTLLTKQGKQITSSIQKRVTNAE